jgi:hypothetical protein
VKLKKFILVLQRIKHEQYLAPQIASSEGGKRETQLLWMRMKVTCPLKVKTERHGNLEDREVTCFRGKSISLVWGGSVF